MRIGEISKRLRVCPDTIRRLERQGAITPKRDWNGHRRFDDQDLEHIKRILFDTRSRPLRSFVDDDA